MIKFRKSASSLHTGRSYHVALKDWPIQCKLFGLWFWQLVRDQERNTLPKKPGATHHFIDTRKRRQSYVFSVAKNHIKFIVQQGWCVCHGIEFSLEKVCILLGQRRKRALMSLVHVQSDQHVPACRIRMRFGSLYTLIKTHLIHVPRCSCGFLRLR